MLKRLVVGSAAQDSITMFQVKTTDIAYRKRLTSFDHDRANRYWKLGLNSYRDKTIKELAQDLNKRGYKCREEKVSRPGVVDAIVRYQRGLMSYEGCSVNELQAFCKARGLSAKGTSASRLAHALEQTDDLMTFPRFFDLPAEIRNVIYELHFHGFDPFRTQYVQPPLTLASRQLRSEALPLFYDCATFELSASTSYRPRRRGVHQFGSNYINIHSSCFEYMPAAIFSRVKKFDLTWADISSKSRVEVSIRFTATSELENPSSTDLTLRDALRTGLESKFKTIENAREMLEIGKQPLMMNISGGLFNPDQAKKDQARMDEKRTGKPGRHVSIGALMLRNARFD